VVALSLLLTKLDGEENRKEKAKLVGWDKNNITEQQRDKKITIILKKRYSEHNFLTT